MNMNLKLIYVLELEALEFNLIQRALRGTLKPEDKPQAEDLQLQLMQLKVKHVKHMGDEAAKLDRNLEATK